jgi:hypothetical protein
MEIREFATGATRDTDEGKLDIEGFLNPLVLKRFSTYMHRHRVQSDGQMRDADNWQRGIPFEQLMKSFVRHAFELWIYHRGGEVKPAKGKDPQDVEEILCALLFNVQGMILDCLKGRNYRG